MVLVVENSRNAGMRADHLRLVEQGELAGLLQHALDDEHHVGAAGIVLVEAERRVGLQRVGQDALAELGDLLAVLQHDRVLADEIDAADVAVEVDADAGPVEPGRHLLDVGRLAGAVIALDHDAAVVLEAGQDRQRHVAVEDVVVVHIRHVVVRLGVGGHFQVGIDPEQLANGHLHVRQAGNPGLGLGWHVVSFPDLSRCWAMAPHRLGHSLERCWRTLDEPSLLQIVISLDDFAQLVFGPFVPPVGVGVMALDQLLEARLDLVPLGPARQIEGFQRFQLERPEGPALLVGSAGAPAEEAVRVGEAAAYRHPPGRAAYRAPRSWRPPSRSDGGR